MTLSLSWPEDKFVDSIISKFGRGEWYLIYTSKSLRGTCFSISLLTPIFRDTVG